MAILNSLINTGESRLLGKVYMNDLSIGDDLTVQGNIETQGTLNIGKNTAANALIYLNNKLAIQGKDTWLRINEKINNAQPFSSGVYFGNSIVRTDGQFQIGNAGVNIEMSSSTATFKIPTTITSTLNVNGDTTLNKAIITTANIDTANIQNVNVYNTLRAAKYSIETVQNLGGHFLVCPTIEVPSQGNEGSFSCQVTRPSSTSNALTIAFTDNSLATDTFNGTTWTANSKVKVSGMINNIAIGTCDGTITSWNKSTKVVTVSIVCGTDISSRFSTTATAYTSAQVSNLSIMMYEVYTNNTTYPIGIYLTAYGDNKYSYIDVYGGTSAKPTTRMGKLDGLDAVNGTSPIGWGFYSAQNGYFQGTIVSSAGKIGGFTIGSDAIYSSTNALGTTANNVYVGTEGISLGTTFKVTKAGALTAISGSIGNWTIGTNEFHTGTWGSNNSAMLCTGTQTAKAIGGSPASTTGWVFTAGANFGVTKTGDLYANSAHISGEITATSGTIGGCNIVDGSLSVPAANITGTLSADRIAANSLTIGKFVNDDQEKILNDNIKIGGRNLIRNTNVIDLSSTETQPNINGDVTYGRVIRPTSSTISEAEHGVRDTVTTATRPYLGFGVNDVNGGLHGLEAGRSYTWSFDYTVKTFSGTPSTTATYYLRAYMSYIPDGGSAYNSDTYKVVHTFDSSDLSDRGSVISGRCEFTFEPPAGATAMRLWIATTAITDTFYEVGDFVELRNVKLEEGNVATAWSPAPEDVDKQINDIKIGGRNLFINTNVPDVSTSAKRPRLIGQIQDTSVTGSAYTVEHGIGIRSTASGQRPMIRFGANSGDARGMNGLVAGKTYTISFDCKWKVISNAATGITTPMTVFLYDDSAETGVLAWRRFNFDTAEAGVESSGRCEATFTLPDNVTMFYLLISASSSNTSLYNTGDYFELQNLKLEEGNKATAWTPAPEDQEQGKVWYAECDTAAATVDKVATIIPATSNFNLTIGTTINVKNTNTNSGAVGSLTLNVNNTGAKNIKYINNNGIANIPGANYLAGGRTYQFIYDGTYWVITNMNYNSDTINRTKYQAVLIAAEAITSGHIICGTSSGYRNLGASVSFDLSYPLLYAATTINKGATSGTRDNNYTAINGITYTNTGTITAGANGKTIYLIGSVSDNTFTIAAAPFLTTTIPTSENNLYYIPLGVMTSATAGYFLSSNKLYAYINGAFQTVDTASRNLAEDAVNASESLNEDIYGEPFYQYTVDGVTYDVWKAEDGKYYYDDGSGTDAEVSASSLDQDDDGYIVVRHGGMQDTVEKIAGSVLIDSVEPSVIIQAKHIEGTDERTAGIKITDERVSFKKNGEEVAYIDSNEDEGVIDINNARIHVTLRIGQLEIFDHDGGIGIRRYDD